MRKFNKFLLTLILFGFTTTLAYTELHRPNRIFEVSEEVEVGATNNYFKLQDYITGHVKHFDFEKMADEISDEGWTANFDFWENTAVNFNFSEKFRLGFFANASGSGHVDANKALFKYLAYDTDQIEPRLKKLNPLELAAKLQANDIDYLTDKLELPRQSEIVKLGGFVDVYATAGVSLYANLLTLGINVKPTYYMPLIHVPETLATASYSITDKGLLKAEAVADLNIYTAFDYKYFDKHNPYRNIDRADQIMKNLDNGGFAIDFEVERNFADVLDIGLWGQVPLSPGRMKYLTKTKAYANYTVDLLKELEGFDTKESDYDIGDKEFTRGSFKYYRPLRYGAEILLKPADVLGLYAKGGMCVRNPYDADIRKKYPEYDCALLLSAKNIINLSVGTAYENEIFIQKVGLGLNFRIVEVIAKASLRGETFAQSFDGKGAGAYVGLKIGF